MSAFQYMEKLVRVQCKRIHDGNYGIEHLVYKLNFIDLKKKLKN